MARQSRKMRMREANGILCASVRKAKSSGVAHQ
jgi:hypothetical protein